jgi:hypothetical protein
MHTFLQRLSGAIVLAQGTILEDIKARLLGKIFIILFRVTGRAIRRRTLIEDQAPRVQISMTKFLLDP